MERVKGFSMYGKLEIEIFFIARLRSYLQSQSTCRLHQMLGDFLSQTGDHLEALDQYSKALG